MGGVGRRDAPGRGHRALVARRVRALVGPVRHEPREWGPGDQEPEQVARLRWQPERRVAVLVGVAVVLAAVLTLWWVLSARPRALAVHEAGTAPSAAGTGAAAPVQASPTAPASASQPAAALVVDVAGKVRRPGVYRLAAGSRVIDAVHAAGGILPGTSTATVNLAAPLRDGEQVAIGVPGAPAVAGPEASVGGAGGSGPLDLNAATSQQLEQLPGVGPVLAQHILDWRLQHGRFSRVQQLTEVSGIGPAKFATLKPLVTV